ncbi:hypothetical protein EVAR_15931_1 [Eumeta japonica]|uniref:Uncharacterized protein n=1 Tax=Eumeta variegata TaxID=151549 RepID=A0A4C1UL23_EUMVA|nr:hypothetical protein EVAR_15931_1 [Eumeta japonica]
MLVDNEYHSSSILMRNICWRALTATVTANGMTLSYVAVLSPRRRLVYHKLLASGTAGQRTRYCGQTPAIGFDSRHRPEVKKPMSASRLLSRDLCPSRDSRSCRFSLLNGASLSCDLCPSGGPCRPRRPCCGRPPCYLYHTCVPCPPCDSRPTCASDPPCVSHRHSNTCSSSSAYSSCGTCPPCSSCAPCDSFFTFDSCPPLAGPGGPCDPCPCGPSTHSFGPYYKPYCIRCDVNRCEEVYPYGSWPCGPCGPCSPFYYWCGPCPCPIPYPKPCLCPPGVPHCGVDAINLPRTDQNSPFNSGGRSYKYSMKMKQVSLLSRCYSTCRCPYPSQLTCRCPYPSYSSCRCVCPPYCPSRHPCAPCGRCGPCDGAPCTCGPCGPCLCGDHCGSCCGGCECRSPCVCNSCYGSCSCIPCPGGPWTPPGIYRYWKSPRFCSTMSTETPTAVRVCPRSCPIPGGKPKKWTCGESWKEHPQYELHLTAIKNRHAILEKSLNQNYSSPETSELIMLKRSRDWENHNGACSRFAPSSFGQQSSNGTKGNILRNPKNRNDLMETESKVGAGLEMVNMSTSANMRNVLRLLVSAPGRPLLDKSSSRDLQNAVPEHWLPTVVFNPDQVLDPPNGWPSRSTTSDSWSPFKNLPSILRAMLHILYHFNLGIL